ncbi:TIGR02587 family membrane protein [Ramlibacter sp. USB13]|uniref:TIGR02587 family membrane protein n=1 Tax=Ramlibacter cellulosilyticus TaxID=2764187 RepID=A0A923MTM7_9BURK|nr:TIGR02587 family membrane protein [Ramlibacter cellulosilyticus]MBC5784965.1 TIGR02587 family membrane protein [Ramlibacter cellulosilyticus]
MAGSASSRSVQFGIGLARAFGGAVIFGLPLLMTMEMWSLGAVVPAWKLAVLLVAFLPVLVLLSWHAGFEPTFSWRDDVVDALVAYAVGWVSSAVVLCLFGVVTRQDAPGVVLGAITLQAVPASIGALLSQTQLGERQAEPARGPGPRYASEVFIMGVGALFLAFNVAPTEEMQRIAELLPRWGAVVLLLVSVALMHAFVYSVAFRGAAEHREDTSFHSLFLRYTLVGYALVLLLSAWMLWSFGRLDGVPAGAALRMVVVLGFPAAVGAAAARLIL